MRILVDSNILFWAILDSDRISRRMSGILADPDNVLLASAVSLAELRIKQRIGKLTLPEDFDALILATGFEILPFEGRHAHWLLDLPLHHRDPFDRMLIAQAAEDGLSIVTADNMFERYPVSVLLN